MFLDFSWIWEENFVSIILLLRMFFLFSYSIGIIYENSLMVAVVFNVIS